jgi:hypothetical protein
VRRNGIAQDCREGLAEEMDPFGPMFNGNAKTRALAKTARMRHPKALHEFTCGQPAKRRKSPALPNRGRGIRRWQGIGGALSFDGSTVGFFPTQHLGASERRLSY